MTLDRAADFIWIVGAMVLAASALVARKGLPHRPKATIAIAWLAIFVILFGVAHWIDVRR
jgi:hypothetical protein